MGGDLLACFERGPGDGSGRLDVPYELLADMIEAWFVRMYK